MQLFVLIMLPVSLLAQVFHDIAPPVSYSLTPTWLIYSGCALALAALGVAIWYFHRRQAPPAPPKLPRQLALDALEQTSNEVEHIPPYEFSIKVSDILRRYVTDQYGLPVTRQTSVEFLERLARNPQFSGDEKSLLQDFLDRCDLIKFARYDATTTDSRSLVDEAVRFVKGAELAAIA
ncbi:MAG: DUF4381 family protein [Chthoniobacterales bacterium]